MGYMKKILCFGDSNTYGFDPQTYGRYDKNTRWCCLLSDILGDDYLVIEEGMNNRTAFFNNPVSRKESGQEYLESYMRKNKDIDICILSLGTNDAQSSYTLDKNIARRGLRKLISIIRKYNLETKIIIVPPVKITEDLLHSEFSELFDKNSIEIIKEIFPVFEPIAKNTDCYYFDFNKIVQPSKYDGIHYTKESHRIIAENLAGFITDNIK